MIRAILFDLDDTLLDFNPEGAAGAYREGARRTHSYLQGRGVAVGSFEKFYQSHCAMSWRSKWIARLSGREQSVRHVLRRLCVDLRLQRDEVSLARLGWLWYEPMAESATVAADVLPTLASLREAGVRLGIVCNTPLQGDVIDRHLELERLLEFFPVRIYSSDVGHRKPDRRIFQAALDQMGVRPPEAIYVGDMPRIDMVGARRAGMGAVLRQRQPQRSAAKSADYVISHLAELLDIAPVRQALNAVGATPPAPVMERATSRSPLV